MAAIASTDDIAGRAVSFAGPGPGLKAHAPESDPNSGGIAEPERAVPVDVRTLRAMAGEGLGRLATVTGRQRRRIVRSPDRAVRGPDAAGHPAGSTLCAKAARDLETARAPGEKRGEIAP
jgi:hypothetical protein